MKVLFVMISLLYSIHGISQQINLNNKVTSVLPSGASKLNKAQITAFADKDGYERRAMPPDPQNVYELNNMLLELYGFTGDFRKDDLDRGKTSMDILFKRHSNYTSEIKSFNNCKVQLSKAKSNGKFIYYFSAINDAKNYKLNGILQCVLIDENEAETVLNNLLNSLKFQ